MHSGRAPFRASSTTSAGYNCRVFNILATTGPEGNSTVAGPSTDLLHSTRIFTIEKYRAPPQFPERRFHQNVRDAPGKS